MNSNFGTSLSGVGIKFNQFLHRFGFIVIFIVVAIGLVASIFLLNNVIIRADQANGYVSEINTYTFDQATIDKLENFSDNDTVDTGGRSRLTPFD